MVQSSSKTLLVCALVCALTCALGACSATETSENGFSQVIPGDGSSVSADAFVTQDGTEPSEDVVTNDFLGTDGEDGTLGPDAASGDVSQDGSTGDAVPTDAPTGDVDPGDAPTGDVDPGDAPTGDVDPGDAPTGDAPTGDAPTGDAPTGDVDPGDAPTGDVDPDGGDVEVECYEHLDCEGDPDALPPCTSLWCIEGQCLEASAKIGTQCELSPEELFGGCTVGSCDDQGVCAAQKVVDVPCEDGDPCTQGELCNEAGVCQGGAPLICSPPGPCQASVCDAGVGGCVSFPSWEGQPCNDLNSCTTDTVCDSGVCAGGDNQCICEADEECPDDGDLCNGAPICALQPDGGKACELALDSVVTCEASDNACLSVSCEPETGACVEKSLAGAACTDGDLCTLNDTCDDEGQCVGAPLGCEDEDPCTDDSCALATGVCVFEPSSGSSCSDGDVCTTGDLCIAGVCKGVDKLCDDANACTNDSCDAETGSCASVATPEAECDDASACTANDVCDASGVCSGEAISCDNENPCTGTKCDPIEGCLYDALEIPCDDGDSCTGPDVCDAGACEPSALSCDDGVACTVDTCDPETGCVHEGDDPSCDDKNPCTSDECDLSADCLFSPLSEGECDDESACTYGDSCLGGACVGKNLDCEDGVACTINTCDPVEGCLLESSSEQCDDGNPCTDDQCDPEGGCLNEDNEAGCEDGNACTQEDACLNGLCQPGPNTCGCDPQDDPDLFWSADDGDGEAEFYELFEETFSTLDATQKLTFSDTAASLTGASYTGQVLSYEMSSIAGLNQPTVAWHLGGASYEDSAVFLFWEDPNGDFHDIFCVDDGISNQTWEGAEDDQIPYNCDNAGTDFNVFDDYIFEPGEDPQKLHFRIFMMAVPAGDTFYAYKVGIIDALFPSEACDDEDLCNGVFTCAETAGGAGACEAMEEPVPCDAEIDDPCLMSACDPATGACSVVPVPDGVSCQDTNPCTTDEVCVSGVCTWTPVDCQDEIACTNDQCDPENGGCVFDPVDDNCSDGVECTDNTCDPTQGCIFTPVAGACDDGKPCTLGKCDEVDGCSYEAVDSACDDAIACTVDSCSLEFGCVFDPESSNCKDGNPCTNDLCLGGEGCVHNPTAGVCEDGNPCTIDDTCSNGVCKSGVVNPCDSPNACEAGQCDAATGDCTFMVLTNGTACEDGDACSNPDVCDEGSCNAGPADSCDDGIACTSDSCEPGQGCVNLPGDASCEDDNPCTVDVCDVDAGCQHLVAPEFSACSDGLDGTGPDVCVGGVCNGFQTSEFFYEGNWFCSANNSIGRALGTYGGQIFAVVNYEVNGFFCDGLRSQVVSLTGAKVGDIVANSTNDTELTSIAYDGVFAATGVVGQFVWGIASISYNLGDLVAAFNNQGEHYAAWAGHVKDDDDIKHRTYVVGEHDNGNKGRIRRCLRTNNGEVNCTNLSNGLKSGEQEDYRPIAVDGLVVADPNCNGDAACDDLYEGLAMVSNDTDGHASLVWGDSDDKFDYEVIDDANEVFDVDRPGASSIWISGNEGYLSHFDGDDAWTIIEGPEAMQGLDLTSLGRISGHVLVAGHWIEDESGEAFLFVLPAGSEETDPDAWITVPLGLHRQVRAIHADSDGLTLLGRQAGPSAEPSVFVWYLNL